MWILSRELIGDMNSKILFCTYIIYSAMFFSLTVVINVLDVGLLKLQAVAGGANFIFGIDSGSSRGG